MGDLMRRFQMISAQPAPSYDGIPIFIDNAYFPRRDGAIDDRVADPNWCIVGVFDTGSSASKLYKWETQGVRVETAFRIYNDLSARSVDYWGASFINGNVEEKTANSLGRYILYSLYKPTATTAYLKQGNTYLFKGSDVT